MRFVHLSRSALVNIAATTLMVSFVALFLSAPHSVAQSSAAPTPAQKGTPVTMPAHATGPFEVKLAPQDDKLDPTLGRMTIDKQFHGDLEATSKGQMLTASTAVKGSAGYVAIERVTGTLRGRSGSFVLQHLGTMTQ